MDIPQAPQLPNLPTTPPTAPIPASVVVYEMLRLIPHLLAEVIVGLLLYNHTLAAEPGIVALIAILMGQLYPRRPAGQHQSGGT